MTSELHVVFGAGQVGQPLARLLVLAGKRVRIVKRSSAAIPAGSEIVLGDAADPSFCVEAARGASTVYHCMNPPYDARIWADLVPRYVDNLIAASARTGARLVMLDNLYMLGRPRGRVLNEDTPMDPCSRKGEIRARATERLFEAHRRGDVIATSGRASDFYGPGGTQTGLGDFFWPRVLAGKTAYSPYPARCDTHVSLHSRRCRRVDDARVRGRGCLRAAVDAAVRAGWHSSSPCRAAGEHVGTRPQRGPAAALDRQNDGHRHASDA